MSKKVYSDTLFVASSPSSFVKEMSRVKPISLKKIKKSLLPDIYDIKSSLSIIEKLIKF